MFRRLFVLLVAAAVMLGPTGFAEAAENVLHLAMSGHVAHANGHDQADEGDAHRDLEHGCVGDYHSCGCCTHQPVLLGQVGFDIGAPVPWRVESPPMKFEAGPSGTPLGIFRPPIV